MNLYKTLRSLQETVMTNIIFLLRMPNDFYKRKYQNSGIMYNGNKYGNKLLQAARLISIAFAGFISIFAMDVFSEGYGFRKTILALLIHLVPTFFVILILILSWRKEWIGGITYTILAILYIVFAWGKFHWSAYALISGPLFLSGIFFLVSWHLNKNNLPG